MMNPDDKKIKKRLDGTGVYYTKSNQNGANNRNSFDSSKATSSAQNGHMNGGSKKDVQDIIAALKVILNSSLSNDEISADVLENTEARPKKSNSTPTLQNDLASYANSLNLIEKELKKLVKMITTEGQSQTTETEERHGPKMLNQLDAPKYRSRSSNSISVVNNLDSPDPPKDAFSKQNEMIKESRRTLKRYPGMTNLREIIDGVKIDVNVRLEPVNIQPNQTGEKKLNSLEEKPTAIERISSAFVAAMKRITCSE